MNAILKACGLASNPRWLVMKHHGRWDLISCSNCGESYRKVYYPSICPCCKAEMERNRYGETTE